MEATTSTTLEETQKELELTDRHYKVLRAASSFGHPCGLLIKECRELLSAGYIKSKNVKGWQHTPRFEITEKGRMAPKLEN